MQTKSRYRAPVVTNGYKHKRSAISNFRKAFDELQQQIKTEMQDSLNQQSICIE